MTRYANSLGAYADIKRVFDAAIEHGTVRYEFPTPAKAMSWRGRAYAYRRLMLKLSERALAGTNVAPSTPYDGIFMNLQKGERVITIQKERPMGALTLVDGTPIKPPAVDAKDVTFQDPLLEAAQRLADGGELEI